MEGFQVLPHCLEVAEAGVDLHRQSVGHVHDLQRVVFHGVQLLNFVDHLVGPTDHEGKMLHLLEVFLSELVASAEQFLDPRIIPVVGYVCLRLAVDDLHDATWIVAESVRSWSIFGVLPAHNRDRYNLDRWIGDSPFRVIDLFKETTVVLNVIADNAMTRHDNEASQPKRDVIWLNRLHTLRVKMYTVEELFESVDEQNVNTLCVENLRQTLLGLYLKLMQAGTAHDFVN